MNTIFHLLAEFSRNAYYKGVMPLLGSKLMYNIRVKYAHNVLVAIIALAVIIQLYFGLPTMYTGVFFLEYSSPLFGLLVKLLVMIYYITLTLVLCFDLNALECCLRGYKNSSYYFATKEEFKDIKKDAGLIGEYKSYVLSRSLKVPHRALFNVCVPMRNGSFQEIDSIIITRNIVYVIECKNRAGHFVGEYDKEDWVQYIGNEEHPAKNIYMQNQKHIMAIEQFLLDRGIIQNGQNVCINMVLTTGEMTLPTKDMPLGFTFGDLKHARKTIEKEESTFDDGTDTSGVMEEIYEALLPYALYTKQERQTMMQMRNARSESKEFALGGYRIQYVEAGIPGVTEPGETAIVRSNRLYTQVQVDVEGEKYWQTRTDIGNQMPVNGNQISRGVDKGRIEAYKQAVAAEPELMLKKITWILLIGVIVAIFNLVPTIWMSATY